MSSNDGHESEQLRSTVMQLHGVREILVRNRSCCYRITALKCHTLKSIDQLLIPSDHARLPAIPTRDGVQNTRTPPDLI